MIEFRNGLLYKDGLSIIQIIEKDASLYPNVKNYEKKMLGLQEQFWKKLMSCYIEDIENNESAMSNFESTVSSKETIDKIRENLFNLILFNPNIELIFKKAYYQFKSEFILEKGIKSIEGIDEVRDEGLETATDILHVGETSSAGLGFLSIFFSKKYRFMSDKEIKRDIFKSIIVWIIVLIASTILTYLIFKFIKL